MSSQDAAPPAPLADLLAARARARGRFRAALVTLEAAAAAPGGVTEALEAEALRLRDEWRRAEDDLAARLAATRPTR